MDNWSIINYLREKALESGELMTLPKPIYEARVFSYVLDQIPISILDKESLAGDFGLLCLDEQESACLERDITQANFTYSSPLMPRSDEAVEVIERFHCFGEYSSAHTCLDYWRIISYGLKGYIDNIISEASEPDSSKADYLRGMEIALRGVVAWAGRYARHAQRLAEETEDTAEKKRLLLIAKHCSHVPLNPARTFHEALQSIWLVHAAIGISEYCDASLSLGRVDQYLLALYQQALADGKIEAELEAQLIDLHLKLNRYGDAACTVNLGGLDADGCDLFNPLSATIVRVVKKLQLPSPILAARIHPDIPQAVFDSLLNPKLASIGQPTFYGELPCRAAMSKRGVSPDNALEWTANSCMGLMMAGQEVSNMWGAVVNMLLPLELALNAGKPFVTDLPITLATRPCDTFACFDELFETYLDYLGEILEFCIRENQSRTRWVGQRFPNPYLSALLDDCIAKGKDRADGGARYHVAIVEAFGLVNVADALLAIRQLAFEQKRFSISEMVAAAKVNFENYPALHTAILDVPKYGNNQPVVDEMAAMLAKRFADKVVAFNTPIIQYAPSFHTLIGHVVAGSKTSASLDGRKTGEPLAKNIGSTPGRAIEGHTSLLKSATAIDQNCFFGGQAIDLSFEPNMLNKESDSKKIQSLLQTYFYLGGLQVQINALSAETLRQAIIKPDEHEDMIVRIAGYSMRFVELNHSFQEEMVTRFSCGM